IPENDRELLEFVWLQLDGGSAIGQRLLGLARHRNARKVALDVGAEDRHASVGKALCQNLQRHRFAGSGCASDKAMPVGILQQQALGSLIAVVIVPAGADEDAVFGSHALTSSPTAESRPR